VARTIELAGADSAVQLYRSLRTRYPAIAFEEQQLNALGSQLIATGKTEAAIAIFRANVEAYPKSANVYDSLGEAYMRHGDNAQAIANYERSLALDPGNENAVKMLTKLKAP
jgi:Flp pilus assembly protein TadD